MRNLLVELLSMIIQGYGEIVSGYLWALASPILSSHPSILAALPGLAEDRGAVYGSLAAKYSTMLYTGEASSAKELLNSKVTHVAVILGIIGGLYVIALTSIVGNPLGSLLYFLVSRGITLTVLVPFSAYACYLAFIKGLNVDLVVVSLTTIIADITSAASLLITFNPVAIIPILMMLYVTLTSIKYVRAKDLKSYKEFMASTLIASTISTVAGFILVAGNAQSNPALLFIAPITMALNGSASMNFTSWLGTALSLGEVEYDKMFRSKKVYVIWGRITFTVVSALTLVLGSSLFFLHYSFKPLIWALTATLILRIVTPILSILVTSESFKRGWDPDLITIPVLSSLNDVLSAQALTLVTILIK
ncbi:hypothetical protein IPA_01435 [Ignicoccus pacificus DSM 13166]|uniref:SLC41A/MgtE integral membrane domain-containing protein n=1 Tax=Ignicoccus pacificus DSM 13166 TaxID=940294 RepID=A0A977KBJ8_9CREN|nr:hypothetical protein IPA_01435 [Ignicoccus pacificus DSM 13166]